MNPAESATPVASRKNPLIRRIARLDRDADCRHREGVYLLWGWKVIEEALREPGRLERILVGSRVAHQAAGRSLVRRALRESLPVTRVEESILEDLAPGSADQGLLALARMARRDPDDMLSGRKSPVLLVADRIQDPGNMGTMVRLGEAAGIAGVLTVPGTVDPYHTRAARASSGSILRVPVARIPGVADFVPWCRERRLRIAATLPEGGIPCQEADLRGGMALVVGNEGEGVSRQWLEAADVRLTLSMGGTAQSLNVTLATAMVLYEAFRQREESGRGPG